MIAGVGISRYSSLVCRDICIDTAKGEIIESTLFQASPGRTSENFDDSIHSLLILKMVHSHHG